MKAELTDATLGQIVIEALRLRDQMRADGATEAELTDGLAKTLKESWPTVRPWRYICDVCGDTGWEHRICTPATPCGRPFAKPGQAADDYTGRGQCGPEHTYVTPCTCLKGVKLRDAHESRRTESDYLGVGKVTKPPTRFGR